MSATAQDPNTRGEPAGERPDLLLALCPPWGHALPPIATATLSACLRAEGFAVRCLDLNAAFFAFAKADAEAAARFRTWPVAVAGERGLAGAWDADRLHLWSPPWFDTLFELFRDPVERFVEQAARQRPRAIGLSTYRDNLHFTLAVAERLRQRLDDAAILLGGPWLPGELDPARLDPDVVDAFVVGEGERTIVRLAAAVRAGGRAAVRAMWTDGPVLPGEPALDLDALPFPDYEGIDLAPYEAGHVTILSSRGCPFRCPFCSDHLSMGAHRLRGIPHVLAELRHAVNVLGCREITFNDLLVNARPGRLAALCRAILEASLRFEWDATAVFHPELSPDLLALARRAGCRLLLFGLESGSDRVLARMRKPFRTDLARRVVRDAHAAGIRCKVNVIVGYPGETEEDFERTLGFLEENAPALGGVGVLSTFHFIRGTRLWEERATLGVFPPDADEESWELPDGNTLEVRIARAERVVALCRGLGLPLEGFRAEGDRANLRLRRAHARLVSTLWAGELGVRVQDDAVLFLHGDRRVGLVEREGLRLETSDGRVLKAAPGLWERTRRKDGDSLAGTLLDPGGGLALRHAFLAAGPNALDWRLVLHAQRPVSLTAFTLRLHPGRNYAAMRVGTRRVPVPVCEGDERGAPRSIEFATAEAPFACIWSDPVGETVGGWGTQVRSGPGFPLRVGLSAGERTTMELSLPTPMDLPPGERELVAFRFSLAGAADPKRTPFRVARRGPLGLEFQDGAVRIVLAGRTITAQAGLLFDLDLEDGERLTSVGAEWNYAWQQDAGDRFFASLGWGAGRPGAHQFFAVGDDGITWEARLVLREPLAVERVKAGVVLDDGYTGWRAGDLAGSVARAAGRWPWRIVGPADGEGRLPFADGHIPPDCRKIVFSGPDLPGLAIELDADSIPRAPIVQCDCEPGVYGGFYLRERRCYDAGVHRLSRIRVRLEGAEDRSVT